MAENDRTEEVLQTRLYWPGERAKKEMRKLKTDFFAPPIEEEVLPKPKKKPQFLTKSQVGLVNQLVALNVSKVTGKYLVEHSTRQVIKKWIKAIHHASPKDKGAFLVKAIKEGWQVSEEYLQKEEE